MQAHLGGQREISASGPVGIAREGGGPDKQTAPGGDVRPELRDLVIPTPEAS
jgi:hypothetical protein